MGIQNQELKVAYLVADTGKRYGIEKSDDFLLKELKKLVDVSLFKLPYSGTVGSFIRSRSVITGIANQGFNLYHTSNNSGVILKQLDLPTVFTVHHPSSCFTRYLKMDKQKVGLKIKILGYLRYWFEKVSLNHACSIIAISNFTKRVLIDDYGVPTEKIVVISDGVDKTLFSPARRSDELRNRYGGKKIVFYCGRLEQDKNVERSILAVKKPKEDTSKDYVFLIAGSGAQENYLRQLVSKLDLDNAVYFLGRLDDEELSYYYASSDVFLNPSLLEGFGMTNVEAMASGLPVISSKIEPTVEVVNDCGLLVNPLSVDEIFDALRKLLESKKLRKDLRDKGLKRSKAYSWQQSARQVVEVYKKALEIP